MRGGGGRGLEGERRAHAPDEPACVPAHLTCCARHYSSGTHVCACSDLLSVQALVDAFGIAEASTIF